jgi:DNA modification methylase
MAAESITELRTGARSSPCGGYIPNELKPSQSSGVAGSSGRSVPHDCGANTPALRVLAGDCRKVLKELEAESVQCCITSPPYWGLRDYGHQEQIGQEKTPEEYVAAMVDVFREVRRVLKADGTCWLNLGDSYIGGGRGFREKDSSKQATNIGSLNITPTRGVRGYKSKDLVGIPWAVAFALRGEGWYLRSDIIWHKPNGMPESVTDRPTKNHEYIFLLTKSESYFYDADAIKEPVKQSSLERIGRGIADGNKWQERAPGQVSHSLNKPRMNVKFGGNKAEGYGRRKYSGKDWSAEERVNKRSVWTVATHGVRDAHFATFSAALIAPCILAGTRAGDVVLDPFGGSGTTGAAALTLGRKAVLIELNPAYAKLIEQRTTTTMGLAL